MTRAEYQARRSHARLKWRACELHDEQAWVSTAGEMHRADIQRSQILLREAQYAERLVPGGLTMPYKYRGTCLLAEWRERRHRVHAAIHARHVAESVRQRKAA